MNLTRVTDLNKALTARLLTLRDLEKDIKSWTTPQMRTVTIAQTNYWAVLPDGQEHTLVKPIAEANRKVLREEITRVKAEINDHIFLMHKEMKGTAE